MTPWRPHMSKLVVTSGSLGAANHVTAPTFRAEIPAPTPTIVTLDWAYLGPSAVDGPLDSGINRRQIGLKLLSINPCNLLYVMREVAPESRIFVQAKINPGKRTSEECGSAGYINLGSINVPLRDVGKLQATFQTVDDVEQLEVREQGVLLLTISLEGAVAQLKGNYGVRSDSGRFFFKLTP